MIYRGNALREISFPLGGIGSGCVGLQGNGSLADWEIFNSPNKGSLNGYTHIAVRVTRGEQSFCRVLQGDHVKDLTGSYTGARKEVYDGFGFGPAARTMAGFPHFRELSFRGEFPIAELSFSDPDFPLPVRLVAFNPLIPLEPDASSLPAAFFEVEFENVTGETLTAEAFFTLGNPFPRSQNILTVEDGISTVTLKHAECDPALPEYGELALSAADADIVQPYWYRGSWQDGIVTFWNELSSGGALRKRQYDTPAKGDHCTLGKALTLRPGERGRARFLLSWYCPNNHMHWKVDRAAWDQPGDEELLRRSWKNYYAVLYDSARAVGAYALKNWEKLYTSTDLYRKTLFSSTLDAAVLDAAASTLSVLKSPAIYRLEDGSFYGFEGVHEHVGSCEGTCQHVYNYAYALCFLFPSLERSIRDLEFRYATWNNGATAFRLPLPLREPREPKRSCLDGQMGCVIKTYREWKLSGDDAWLRSVWPTVKKVLEYAWSKENADCWDRNRDGVLEGRQHHTLDVELYGPSSWLQGFYLAALKAAAEMADYLGEAERSAVYLELFEKGKKWTAEHLFNGRYFIQQVDVTDHTLIERYGGEKYWNNECGEIKYQIGEGCAIDQLLGQWHANICGLGDLFDPVQRRVALQSLFHHNFKPSMRNFVNPWRNFCVNDEAGTVICTYPQGAKKPRIPITYCEETMHGFEYAFAGLLISEGFVDKGLTVVRAVRDRYRGDNRNPWNEIECGSNYARSMASFALLPILSGFSFDLPRNKIGFAPVAAKEDFACLWSVGTAWGQVKIERECTVLRICGGKLTLSAFAAPCQKSVPKLLVDGKELPCRYESGTAFFDKITIEHSLELR